ncbi:hypothetical protein Q6D67_02315 [Haliea sp. E1-2-M8]|uniref:hypothetical protein n=1 Tax=Haliea sp. E1-2-M8 TaxID=3064706 RepID=UPI0027210449|nr:hypothetical protein [Haliea sp. E1-2-M8]MDO8860520.1 hypothetical protein [Haliea sp. E1-2-M8]
MSDKHPVFEARDLAPPVCKDKQGEEKYTGVERRKTERRDHQDRREEVRFDITKEDRRSGSGRRKDDKTPKFW